MSVFRSLKTLQAAYETPTSDLRAKPRFTCRSVSCGSGEILDLSLGGLRMRTPAKPPRGRGPIGLVISSDVGRVQVAAEIVWAKRAGWREWELGMRFTDPDAVRASGLFKLIWDPVELASATAARRRA
jgi:hypothetical protein